MKKKIYQEIGEGKRSAAAAASVRNMQGFFLSFGKQETDWIHRFSSDDVSLYLRDAGSEGLRVLQLPLQAARCFWG